MWGSSGGGYPPKGKGQAAGTPGGLLVPNAQLGQGFLVPIAGGGTPRGQAHSSGMPAPAHTMLGWTTRWDGTLIMAHSRVVVFSGYLNGRQAGSGRQHPNGWTTTTSTVTRKLVKVGDQVGAGQPIATVGQTGNAEGRYVHFETRVNGTPVDPSEPQMQTTAEMPDLMNREQSRQIGPNVQTSSARKPCTSLEPPPGFGWYGC